MAEDTLTVDELIATINHSHSIKYTVIIEGQKDLIAFRRFEVEPLLDGLSVFPIGGREAVLRLFENRHRIRKTKKIIFIVDQDTWVYCGVPPEYVHTNMILTNGYSIENDLYQDGKLEAMLGADKEKFRLDVERFVHWYALAVQRHMRDRANAIDTHPNKILDSTDHYVQMTALQDEEVYPDALQSSIYNDYARVIRGKSLIKLLLRYLAASGRTVKHSFDGLLEYAAAADGPNMQKFRRQIKDTFQQEPL